MQTHVIISYDGTDNDHDALALGRIFGDAGARVSLAYVRHATEADPAAEQRSQAQAPRSSSSAARSGSAIPRSPATSCSAARPARACAALAEREHADLVVFGSDWHTAPGHVQPGQSALRLIDGGPVSIAIAAAGLRDRSDAAPAHDRARRRRGRRGRARRPPSGSPRCAGDAAGAALAGRARPARRRLAPGHRPWDASASAPPPSTSSRPTTASVLIVARGVAFDVAQSADRDREAVHAQ